MLQLQKNIQCHQYMKGKINMEDNRKVKIQFYLHDNDEDHMYTAQENDEELSVLDLIHHFRRFLVSAGYLSSVANRVTYKGISEEDEEEIYI